jgi:ribosomal protein S18 acetylase RimI-like enzyme
MAEVIRVYRPGDKKTLFELWRRCNLLAPWNDLEADVALATSGDHSEIFVATKADRLIGSVMVGHDGHRGWLYFVGVDPDFRGGGLGSRLLRHAEEWLSRLDVPKVQLIIRQSNLAAGNFYARNGYSPNPSRIMQRWLTERPGAPPASGAADGILRFTRTYLEMTARPHHGPPAPPHRKRLALMRAVRPTLAFYRFLYSQAGERWLWWERREMSDDDLMDIIADDRVEIYVLYSEGVPAGFAELDCRPMPEVNLACFGIMEEFAGQGLADYLLHAVVDAAWGHEPTRLTVATNNLEHHKAIALYQRVGFKPYRQEKAQHIDPRRNGLFDCRKI